MGLYEAYILNDLFFILKQTQTNKQAAMKVVCLHNVFKNLQNFHTALTFFNLFELKLK